ncbi:MAG TPA: hypothetical protein VMK12_12580, partial [Anaeromyxobacteraceae bacterium]|nr:hypothetical protein [Anaeromyxobacteraceae bacterium]
MWSSDTQLFDLNAGPVRTFPENGSGHARVWSMPGRGLGCEPAGPSSVGRCAGMATTEDLAIVATRPALPIA